MWLRGCEGGTVWNDEGKRTKSIVVVCGCVYGEASWFDGCF